MNAPINPPSFDSLNPLLSFGRGIAQYDAVRPEQIAPAIEYLLGTCEAAVAKAVDATGSIVGGGIAPQCSR